MTAITSTLGALASSVGTSAAGTAAASAGSGAGSNQAQFQQMLAQYNALQQQTMLENMEMQAAQAFWNPLESMSKKDATS